MGREHGERVVNSGISDGWMHGKEKGGWSETTVRDVGEKKRCQVRVKVREGDLTVLRGTLYFT